MTDMGRIEQFLIENGLHEACYDFDEHVETFTAEMNAGLAGRKSSLLMLPSWLGVAPKDTPDGEVIAVDAGGTNLRIATVGFKPGASPVVSRYEKHRIPGSDGAISKDEFFSRIAAYVGDRTGTSDRLGFCFSFPSEIGGYRDRRIIGFKKEIKVEGSEGAALGAELNAAFSRAGKAPLKVTALNDSAAVLIGAVFARGAYGMGGYICLIYGTGLNICYYDTEKGVIINTEAGGYDRFRQYDCDIEIDAESDNPGDHRFEKMVSGAYFAEVALKAIRLAAAKGLFGAKACEAVGALAGLDAIEIDKFMRGEGGPDTKLSRLCYGDEDEAVMRGILGGVFDRAAKLLAIAITAVLKKSGATEANPALIVAEGSTFHKGFRFPERFESRMAGHAGSAKPYELASAEDLSVIGAAASVFL